MADSPPGSQSALRAANQRRVVAAIRSAGSLTQAEIARATGLSAATVSNIVNDLAATSLLRVTSTVSSGRRARAVSVSRSAGLAIGIDFGRRHLRVAVADLAHEVLAEEQVPLPHQHRAEHGIDVAAGLVERLLAQAGGDRAAVVGVGVGIPGPIDSRTGRIGASTILPEWVGVRPADAVRSRLDLPVHVENDANLGVLAEVVWGCARGHRNAAYIKIATGIGAGLVINGQLHRGVAGTAGEIGHTTIDERGRICRCGNRGCLETFASVPVILGLLEQSHGANLSVADVIRMARQGDIGCQRVIEDVGRHLGVAVANLANLLNPQTIVIGGDLAAAGDLLLDPLRDVVRRFAIPSAAAVADVVPSSLGSRAQVLGALALVFQEAEQGADGTLMPVSAQAVTRSA
ncbi:MAG TPA: ROK family transcriptional regulator [Jiangellaceae bacterium]|nr:ROK family transcriptional regulator [Jiangellaceae bacterium]